MNLLRVDSGAALLAGVLTAALTPVLAAWYGLPETVLYAIAIANLAYGSYSGWLAVHPCPRPLLAIKVLAVANLSWTLVCLLLAARFHEGATWLGLTHLLAEGAFVGALGVSEWQRRQQLRSQA